MEVRGKRKQPQPSSSDETHQKRLRGQPMKRASELLSSKRSVLLEARKRYQQQQAIRPAQKQNTSFSLSPLESLPVELIQQIFFHALELNMAYASSALLGVLSKDNIHKSLILFAFFDDDEHHPVETKHFLPAEYRLLHVREKLRLQKTLMKCSWCDLGVLRAYMPILTRLRMAQAWHEENEQEELYGKNDQIIPVPESHILVSILPDITDTERLERHYFAKRDEIARSSDGKTTGEYFPRVVTWNFTVRGSQIIKKALGKSFSTLAVRHIPDHILCGSPWIPEKLEMLQLLRQGHRFIQKDFILNLSYPAMFEGMASAIREHKIIALKTLLELHYTLCRRDRFTLDQPPDPYTHHYAMPFSHPIPLELFHLAAKQPEMSSDLIHLLAREGIDSVPKDDYILTSWALRNKPTFWGHKWLLKHMEGTETYGLGGRDSPLFINGERNPRATGMRDFPDAEQSFTSELGYLTHGSIAFVPQEDVEDAS